ncbi:hypothetical protein D3C72_1400460 [compost metagenome]
MIREKSGVNFAPIMGQKVTEINRMYPILILDDGHLTIECPWRLRMGNRVIVGQPETEIEDKKEKAFTEFEKALIGNTIRNVIHYEDISDLTLVFEGEVFLDLFHDSSWYEGWQLQGPGHFFVVSTPGGGYSYWKEE